MIYDHLNNPFKSKAEMCKYYGINPDTFYYRVNVMRLPLAQALSKEINLKKQSERLAEKRTKEHERRLQNCGDYATLIEYFYNKKGLAGKCLVEFTDGTRKITSYYQFVRGEVQHPHLKRHCKTRRDSKKEERMSKIWPQKNGMNVKILRYDTARHCDALLIEAPEVPIENVPFRAIENGEIHPLYKLSAKNKNRISDEAVLQNCGLYAKVIDSVSSTKCTIQFDNPEKTILEGVDYQSFLRGNCHPYEMTSRNSSWIEFAITYVMKEFGFCKFPAWSLRETDFERLELDCANFKNTSLLNDKSVAIEIDGIFHKDKMDLDSKKQSICEKNGIILLRIRDVRLRENDDKTNIENTLYIGLNYRNALEKKHTLQSACDFLIQKINIYCETCFEPIIITDNVIDEINDEWPQYTCYSDVINKPKVMKNGEIAWIEKRVSTTEVYVRFESGYLAKCRMTQFKNGTLKDKEYLKWHNASPFVAFDHEFLSISDAIRLLSKYDVTKSKIEKERSRKGFSLADAVENVVKRSFNYISDSEVACHLKSHNTTTQLVAHSKKT